ncbi:hypothetical protein BYI23_D015710 (plasmid) [Burkholderia sp. YI23]|uniref:hypothetical protein n=1 Tax=unclassified Caballeronia TaxID=2646786 RepID=UPI0002388B78|nr:MULTISPECIES: hypothetical protein [unclassified Caballeronia]AET95081.1 hypothetical protein BYI23_D015710 [Burkholderia sp. YI23]MCE4547599.1 hypothetical protein [Caballeronia sp. PC1]MCE4575057.1 hypothetical protein [Caballeronia sp. CLC5]
MDISIRDKEPNWLRHLNNMTAFARQRHQHQERLVELAERHCYVRIGGNGFRLVSIHLDNPCGSLYVDNRAIGSNSSLDAVLAQAKVASHRVGLPGNGKREHRVQASLIHCALTQPGKLASVLGCTALFDELLFLSDEFRLDEIRADVIALGRKGSQYFPVFVELKATRTLKRAIEQLEDITQRMVEQPDAIAEFLAAASGIPAANIEMTPLRLIIWPSRGNGKESASVSIARSKGFHTVGFKEPAPGTFEFVFEC